VRGGWSRRTTWLRFSASRYRSDVGGREAGETFEGDRRFPVVIRLSEASRSDPTQVAQLPVPTSAGRPDHGRELEPTLG
jgi:hypothetical protein